MSAQDSRKVQELKVKAGQIRQKYARNVFWLSHLEAGIMVVSAVMMVLAGFGLAAVTPLLAALIVEAIFWALRPEREENPFAAVEILRSIEVYQVVPQGAAGAFVATMGLSAFATAPAFSYLGVMVAGLASLVVAIHTYWLSQPPAMPPQNPH